MERVFWHLWSLLSSLEPNMYLSHPSISLQVGEEAEETSENEQQKMMEKLDALLKSGAAESEIFAKIEEYKEKFADYGRDRRSAIEFHLRNIERLLMPTQTTSVIMATLDMGTPAPGTTTQSSDSSMSSTNTELEYSTVTSTTAAAPPLVPTDTTTPTPQMASSPLPESTAASIPSLPPTVPGGPPPTAKALFQHLVKYLEVTPEQAIALKDSRFVAKEMDECLKKSLTVLKELRNRLNQCGEDLENEFNTVRTILTPTQAAKFLVWVANNKACMHMLNELWNRVYPQEQQKSQQEEGLLLSRSFDDGASSPTSTNSGPTGSAP